MRSIGGTMFFFGVGSVVLLFLNMQFFLLVWIDFWGPTIGWIIRAGLIVLGGGLWLAGVIMGDGGGTEGEAGD